jgi:hypothetical protein
MSITSKINSIIPISYYELVRTNIAAILAVELAKQKTLVTAQILVETNTAVKKELELYLASIPSAVYESRQLPPGASEMPYLNVRYLQSKLTDLTTHTNQLGKTRFTIESWQSSQTIGLERGDQRASRKLHRLLGACRKILMDKNYYDLLLPNMVTNKEVTTITEYANEKTTNNSDNEVFGEIELSVKLQENVPELTGTLLNGMDTVLEKINSYEVGYIYTF